MKKITYGLLISIFFSCSSNNPVSKDQKVEFEGIIKYSITVESKTPNISTENLERLFGDTMILYFKNGNYRMTYNGMDIKDIYFINNKNKEFDIRRGIDSLFVTSYATEDRKLISSEFQTSNENILNRQCKGLINDLGEVKFYYWFDPSLYVNPSHFKESKFSYINIYFEKAKSLWLKYKSEGRSFNLTYTAISIDKQSLSDQFFTLPNFPESKYN